MTTYPDATLPLPEASNVLKYTLQSTDVLEDMRINVSEEHSDTVLWYKERFLTQREIVDHIVHGPTRTICWTIHRPADRGWYIRIRSPTFAPGIFIPFVPVPTKSPHYSEGALSFHSQTNVTISQDRPSISSVHSYPPTPTALAVQPPSPTMVRAKLEEIPKEQEGRSRKRDTVSTQVTQFILTPHSMQVAHPTSDSLFARALSALKNSRPSHSNSFTLSRIPSASPLSPPPPYPSTSVPSSNQPHHTISLLPPPPVLVYHDRTPVFTAGTVTGLLEIQKTEEQLLGVETSFWIAVALTYLDFLEERDSYLAALND